MTSTTDPCGYCGAAREEHWPGRMHTFVEPRAAPEVLTERSDEEILKAVTTNRKPIPPTPVAMLGEALALIQRAADAIRAGLGDKGDLHYVTSALNETSSAYWRLACATATPASNGRRAGVAPETCMRCDAPLGTTEGCIMCVAKRREDNAPGVG